MRSTSPPTSSFSSPMPLRILTHNIRYATKSPFPGELPWPDRKAGLISQLLYHTRHCPASLICLQEVLHAQLLDILDGLNDSESESSAPPSPESSRWSYVGVGRDDGKQAGEYAPIIYRSDVWDLSSWFTMWLSPTPWTAGSKGWDAASVRIVTVAKLELKKPAEKSVAVLAMNTHLDDQGVVSRRESAKLILRLLKGELDTWGSVGGAFLVGDLNSEVTGDAYRVLNEDGSGLVDIGRLVGRRGVRVYGDEMTFTGFDGHGDGEGETKKIDFIHLSTKPMPPEHDHGAGNHPHTERASSRQPHWQFQGYAVLPNRFDNGIYISDHRAVVGDVTLPARTWLPLVEAAYCARLDIVEPEFGELLAVYKVASLWSTAYSTCFINYRPDCGQLEVEMRKAGEIRGKTKTRGRWSESFDLL